MAEHALTLRRPSLIERIRQNHGLEHATLHLVTRGRKQRAVLAGRADTGGFFVVGAVDTPSLTRAAHEALQRMQNGEKQLAVHPNCGTNFLTSGVMAAVAAMIALAGMENTNRARFERLPIVIFVVTLALIISRPLGLAIQRDLTTTGEVDGVAITGIVRYDLGPITIHRVSTAA